MIDKSPNHYDIAVVGGGLSAASMIHSFLAGLSEGESSGRKINIVVFDKNGNFWTGVPYGNMAQPDFFLIETLSKTDCKLFSRWIYQNSERISDWIGDDCPMLKIWYENNHNGIQNRLLDDIYFPRYFFGLFIVDLLKNIISDNAGLINIEFIKDEIVDILECSELMILKSKDDAFFYSLNVVLAIGSSPKKFPFSITDNVFYSKRYISDDDTCAVFNLEKTLPQSFFEHDSNYHILIIGSGASALETIYHIATRSNVLDKIDKITLLSTSGMLIGGFYSVDFDESSLPPYVTLRTSSDMYIKAARDLYKLGVLNIVKGKAEALEFVSNQFILHASRILHTTREEFSLNSDIVINCCGSGSLLDTSSVLVHKLADRLPINEECRGFNVDNNNQVIGHSNFYVLGPLLNSSFTGKQVESIKAVFREGETVGNHLRNKFNHVI